MPYRSVKQRAFMHARHPDIAARWDRETGGKIVPTKGARVKKKAKKKPPPTKAQARLAAMRGLAGEMRPGAKMAQIGRRR